MSPPTSVTRPDASGKSGVQAGSVYGAIRISPFSSFEPSSLRTTRARPSTTPAEAAVPASAPPGTAAPRRRGHDLPLARDDARRAEPRVALEPAHPRVEDGAVHPPGSEDALQLIEREPEHLVRGSQDARPREHSPLLEDRPLREVEDPPRSRSSRTSRRGRRSASRCCPTRPRSQPSPVA